MEEKRVKKIFSLLKKTYPRVPPMLNFSNPFQLLVATILSAQTTDEQVNKITKELFKRVADPADLAAMRPVELEPFLKQLGLYRNKSRFLVATGQKLMESYGGKVPKNFEDLITLPGVGRKTANVILSTGFGVPAFAVDTHVLRLSRRLGLAASEKPEGVEKALTEKLPPEEWLGAHRRLILHGRKICKARRPDCERCVLKDYCPGYSCFFK